MLNKNTNNKQLETVTTLSARVSHWKNEACLLQETVAGYDRSFGFLCANMERSQLCKAIAKMKTSSGTPLPPAIQSFLARNISADTQLSTGGEDVSTEVHPVMASAEALTRWAARCLKRQQHEGGVHELSRRTSKNETDASLILAETHFKLRDLEQQLRSSQAIRQDLLNKAVEAKQHSRALREEKTNRQVWESGGSDSNSSDAKVEWQKKCYELQTKCDKLHNQLKEVNAQHAKESKKTTENKTLDGEQNWFQSELKSAQNKIRQLRALLQAKQDKIEIMEQLKQIPRRSTKNVG